MTAESVRSTLVGILSSWLWLVTIMVEQYRIQTINKRLQTKAIIIDTGLDRTLPMQTKVEGHVCEYLTQCSY